jgi:hypothetical protein
MEGSSGDEENLFKKDMALISLRTARPVWLFSEMHTNRSPDARQDA